jgi:hypothetical protein
VRAPGFFSAQTLNATDISTGGLLVGGQGTGNATIGGLSSIVISTGQLAAPNAAFITDSLSTSLLSTTTLFINTMFTSSIITNTISAGQIITSTLFMSSISTNTTTATSVIYPSLVRMANVNTNSLSTGTIAGTLLATTMGSLSSIGISSLRYETPVATGLFLSTSGLTVSQAFVTNQATFASTYMKEISVGQTVTSSNFIFTNFSTNFVSTTNISTAAAFIDGLSTTSISSLTARTDGLFVTVLSTPNVFARVLNISSATYGDLRVSSINGQLVTSVTISGNATVTNMTVRVSTTAAALSTVLLSTGYINVQGPTSMIPYVSSLDRWLFGMQQGSGGGGSNRFSYSDTDGSNWAAVSLTNIGDDNAFDTITHNGNYYLATKRTLVAAVGGQGNSTNQTILRSFDGFNWTASDSTNIYGNQGAKGVNWNGRFWVATGDEGNLSSIKYSFNGSNWSNSASVSDIIKPTRELAWNGIRWIVTTGPTANKNLYTSTDGSNWSELTSLVNVADVGAKLTALNPT